MKKTLIALVPVIHTNYLKLFSEVDELLIIGESILENWDHNVHLHRDLRRLDQNLIAELIRKSDLVKNVVVLEVSNLNEIIRNLEKIIMPDEDVSHWFKNNYLVESEVEFKNIFLRWNKPVSTTELEVSPDRETTTDDLHKSFMKVAEDLKGKSANWWRQIGSVLVKDKKIIVSAFNKHVPTQYNIEVYGDLRADFNAGEHHELSNSIHSEASLIGQSAKQGISLDGGDLYVTTFPCPTCAKLVAEAGIKRVFYKDGYSLADAEDVLKNSGIEIILVQD